MIDEGDAEARYIEAITYLGSEVVRVASVYVPNGTAVSSSPIYKFIPNSFAKLTIKMGWGIHMEYIMYLGNEIC